MKMAHVVFGHRTYDNRFLLRQAGYEFNKACKVWTKMWNMDSLDAVNYERHWLGGMGLSLIDVDYDAIRPGNEAWLKEELDKATEADRLKKRAENERMQKLFDEAPDRGMSVVVISGRSKKVKKGETGVVFWKGVNKFDPNKISVGVELKNGKKIYLDSSYVALDFVDFIHTLEIKQ